MNHKIDIAIIGAGKDLSSTTEALFKNIIRRQMHRTEIFLHVHDIEGPHLDVAYFFEKGLLGKKKCNIIIHKHLDAFGHPDRVIDFILLDPVVDSKNQHNILKILNKEINREIPLYLLHNKDQIKDVEEFKSRYGIENTQLGNRIFSVEATLKTETPFISFDTGRMNTNNNHRVSSSFFKLVNRHIPVSNRQTRVITKQKITRTKVIP